MRLVSSRNRRRRVIVAVPLSETEAARLDAQRGETPRAVYLRALLLGDDVEPDGRTTRWRKIMPTIETLAARLIEHDQYATDGETEAQGRDVAAQVAQFASIEEMQAADHWTEPERRLIDQAWVSLESDG